MDTRLEQALEFSRLRHTQYLERRRLQEKLQSDLTMAKGGGRFHIDRNFISFLNLVSPDEGTASIVLLDDNLVPVVIDDVIAFRKAVMQKYAEVTNQYYLDYEAMRTSRSVKKIVGL
jgi:hypothetical protein